MSREKYKPVYDEEIIKDFALVVADLLKEDGKDYLSRGSVEAQMKESGFRIGPGVNLIDILDDLFPRTACQVGVGYMAWDIDHRKDDVKPVGKVDDRWFGLSEELSPMYARANAEDHRYRKGGVKSGGISHRAPKRQ